jgi:hypothetical protein
VVALISHHFVNQLASDIRQKLQKPNLGPLTNKTQLVDIALHYYNNYDLEEKGGNRIMKKRQAKLMTAAIGMPPVHKRHPKTKRSENHPVLSVRS